MINLDTIITGGIGILATITSAWVSWVFARRRYNSEVDNNLIKNMQESLDFYKKLSDDNRARLEEALKRDEDLEAEVRELRSLIFNLMNSICTDLSCQVRRQELKNLGVFKDEEGKNKQSLRITLSPEGYRSSMGGQGRDIEGDKGDT